MRVLVGHGGGVFGAVLGGLSDYRYARVHSDYGMAGRTPYACCVALVFSGSEYVGVMPVVLLDDRVLDWLRQGVPAVNDVLGSITVGIFGAYSHYRATLRVAGLTPTRGQRSFSRHSARAGAMG